MRTYDPILKCVGFLSVLPPPGNVPTYRGTAFFLFYRSPRTSKEILCIVTAAHCAREIQSSGQSCLLRVGSTVCDLGHLDWVYHPDRSVDVAVVVCTKEVGDKIPLKDVIPIEANAFLTEAKLKSKNIGPGDQVGIVGLYALRPGKEKNMPIVHTGHIAMLPEDLEPLDIADPVRNGETLTHSPYLIEAQGLRGLSGAPVFVRRSLLLNLKGAPNEEFMAYGSLWLLGLWHGAWQRAADPILSEELRLSDRQRVPVGVGLAIPAVRIIEAMGHAVASTPADVTVYGRKPVRDDASTTSARYSSGSSLPFSKSWHVLGPTGAVQQEVLASGYSSVSTVRPDFLPSQTLSTYDEG